MILSAPSITADPRQEVRTEPTDAVSDVRRQVGADLAALAFPANPDGLILVMVDGVRSQVYEGLFVGRGRFAFDPAAWARALLSWCVVDRVLPGAPHAIFSSVVGNPSPAVALVVANHEWWRPFSERQAWLVASLAAHPNVVTLLPEALVQGSISIPKSP